MVDVDVGVALGGCEVGVAEHGLMERRSAPLWSMRVAVVCLKVWQLPWGMPAARR